MPTELIDEIIGHRLAELRKASGRSREEVAGVLGIYPNKLASWEVGETRVTAAQLFAFCEAIGCTVGDIDATGKEAAQNPKPLGSVVAFPNRQKPEPRS